MRLDSNNASFFANIGATLGGWPLRRRVKNIYYSHSKQKHALADQKMRVLCINASIWFNRAVNYAYNAM